MSDELHALRDRRIGFIERRHPPDNRGSLVNDLVPLLRCYGAMVDVVHAEEGFHPLHERPDWELAILKSGSRPALHLAAAAEAWGIPSVNTADATRLAQDKLASCALLQSAGLPIARSYLAWLGPETADCHDLDAWLASTGWQRLLLKAARSSRGKGLWNIAASELAATARAVPDGPYLLMEYVPHQGNDLKLFVAGEWMTAIERPFPAETLEEKRGRPVAIPPGVDEITREAGRLLGLTCYGCDFVHAERGWTMVDVNAFPGYKGAAGAPEAIALVIARRLEAVV
jgi:ribosomal protein S6--L-glutamate ligase